jgi:glutathione S-transferase
VAKNSSGKGSAPQVKLYGFVLSHPVTTVRLALERKGIDFEQVNLTVGLHATQLRALGFPRGTVPAMKIDGQKIQGSREIMRALEEIQPEPRLFPADPSLRIAVEDAERWGEETLQPIPRRLFRYVASTDASVRETVARREGLPAPKLAARATAPLTKRMAAKVGADAEQVRADMSALPGLIRRIEQMLKDGIIGGGEPNAADFQIAPTIRVLMNMEDTAPIIIGSPVESWAKGLVADYPTGLPAKLPADWTAPLRDAAAQRA